MTAVRKYTRALTHNDPTTTTLHTLFFDTGRTLLQTQTRSEPSTSAPLQRNTSTLAFD